MALAIKAFVGDILLQTGQALQRTSLRAAGKQVHMPLRFSQYGLAPPNVCPSIQAHESVFVGPKVLIDSDVKIGENSVLRGEAEEVSVHFKASIGARSVVVATEPPPTDRSLAIPLPTIIHESAKVGDDCVITSARLGRNSVIGNGSIVGYGAIVGEGSVIAENSVVPPMGKVPAGEIWGGNPISFKGIVHDDH